MLYRIYVLQEIKVAGSVVLKLHYTVTGEYYAANKFIRKFFADKSSFDKIDSVRIKHFAFSDNGSKLLNGELLLNCNLSEIFVYFKETESFQDAGQAHNRLLIDSKGNVEIYWAKLTGDI